jgi:restriction system protein
MPEITRRRTGEMLRALFEVLMPVPEGVQAREALSALETRLTLSEYEKGEYASGGRRFDKIVRFATVDLVKAGWLFKEKGRWTVTDDGLKAFQEFPDPEAFYKEAVRLYHQWKATQPEDGEGLSEKPEEATAKAASITLEEAEEQAWSEIDQYLRAINPYEFRKLWRRCFVQWVITFRGLRHRAKTEVLISSPLQILLAPNRLESRCR